MVIDSSGRSHTIVLVVCVKQFSSPVLMLNAKRYSKWKNSLTERASDNRVVENSSMKILFQHFKAFSTHLYSVPRSIKFHSIKDHKIVQKQVQNVKTHLATLCCYGPRFLNGNVVVHKKPEVVIRRQIMRWVKLDSHIPYCTNFSWPSKASLDPQNVYYRRGVISEVKRTKQKVNRCRSAE